MFEKIEDENLTDGEKCEVIKGLLKNNPDLINLKEGLTGLSPLHVAVSNNLFRVVELLLNAGISVNAEDLTGKTPLHIAATKGLDQMIVLLSYQPDCDFNKVDMLKQSALHKAIISNHPNCVKTLVLINKIDKTLTDSIGLTAEGYLRKYEDFKLQEILKNAYCYDNMFKRTVLQLAVINDLPFHVESYLSWGAPPNAQDCDGRSALHFAAIEGHLQILLILCYFDQTDIDLVDNYGNTALHYVAEKGHRSCVKPLLVGKLTSARSIKNNVGFIPADLINFDKIEEGEALKKLLSTSVQQTQFNKEFFSLAEKDPKGQMYHLFIKNRFVALKPSLKTDSASRLGRRSSAKSFKKTLQRTTSFFIHQLFL